MAFQLKKVPHIFLYIIDIKSKNLSRDISFLSVFQDVHVLS